MYLAIIISIVAVVSTRTFALPAAQNAICQQYPAAPACASGKLPDCSTCHTVAPAVNPYGSCLQAKIDAAGGSFDSAIIGAIQSTAGDDCDNDQTANGAELLAGTLPGDPASFPKKPSSPTPTAPTSCADRAKESDWNVCGFDARYAFRKMHQDVCGASPSFAEEQALKSASSDAQLSLLDEALSECLRSENWLGKDGVLWRLAHYKIEPLQTIKSGDDQGEIPLGDYEDDYNLFIYHQLEDRDARLILLADYFVQRTDDPTTYTPVAEMPLHPDAGGVPRLGGELFGGRQQWVPREQRAGLLTTLWTAVSRTMFTNVPRTTAAGMLRAHLGIDIAKSQGLVKPSDPAFRLQDFDNKGVTNPDCAFCHEVLDPIAYPFTKYNGLSFNVPGGNVDVGGIFEPGGDSGINIPGFIPPALVQAFITNSDILVPGMYKPRRIEVLATLFAETEPNLGQTPEAGFLLGQPVATLKEWAAVAANSDQFAQALVADYWRLLVGGEPSTSKYKAEYDKLWRDFKSVDAYGVEKMLKKLVRTEAFGAP
jgi:hypothetical protein